MPEESTKPDELAQPSWTPERAGRQVEIVHYPEATAILNNEAKQSIWGPKLADSFQHGMPKDWQQLSTYGHVFVGNVDGQQFLAKYKRWRPDEALLSRVRSSPPGSSKRATYGSESLVNEIKLSPIVQAAVEDPAMQEVVGNLGFRGLRFVEPVMGVIAQHSATTLAGFDEAL